MCTFLPKYGIIYIVKNLQEVLYCKCPNILQVNILKSEYLNLRCKFISCIADDMMKGKDAMAR